MSDLKKSIDKAVASIRKRVKDKPRFAIIIGTGLGGLAAAIDDRRSIPYTSIPGFVSSTVSSHKGQLTFGRIGDARIVAMEGRFHCYEGYTPAQVTFPVRVMRALGAEFLLISNVTGGMNPRYKPGDLVLIDDHINLQGVNPLAGPNDETLGQRFPDMSEPYDRELLGMAERVAMRMSIKVQRGVYVGVLGPNLETRAEYRFLRGIGADVVGMSTVPEVIVGVHCGFKIFTASVVTDSCLPDALAPARLEDIIAVATRAEKPLTALFNALVREIDTKCK
ncbi:MAG: purine-nucleoside phosphorylase [Planctomycetota bacterium]|nr:purine-nucleoside phosphorylase [Planctomycetota bacterium]